MRTSRYYTVRYMVRLVVWSSVLFAVTYGLLLAGSQTSHATKASHVTGRKMTDKEFRWYSTNVEVQPKRGMVGCRINHAQTAIHCPGNYSINYGGKHLPFIDNTLPLPDSMKRACPEEDSVNCSWNADTSGNHRGHSFIVRELPGKAHMVCVFYIKAKDAKKWDYCEANASHS